MTTTEGFLYTLTLISTLGCGLIAGVFFAFSAFVMKAFERLPPGEGMAAMQSINVVILKSLFMPIFLGTAITSVLMLVYSLLRWHEPSAIYLFSGSSFYLIGSLLVTIMFNVPKNDALASVATNDSISTGLWTDYLKSWTAWNHVRTAASLVAAVLFSFALGC